MSAPPLATGDLRVGVVGLGPMGLNHVRAVSRGPGASLAAVYDIHPDRAAAVAGEYLCAAVADVAALAGCVDAAIVATPPATHAEVATALLRRGVHCLIEKPLATAADECEAIAQAAQAGGAIVQVGHIERFNPAVVALAREIGAAPAAEISARRHNPPPGRAPGIDVVADLMIHDIDIILMLKRSAPVDVAGLRESAERVSAVLRFADGTTAHLSADRAAQNKVRELTLTAGGMKWRFDYAARQAWRGSVPIAVDARDALDAQLAAFVAACRGGSNPVPAAAGRAAVAVVARINAALEHAP
ncbi:MAG: Gfo/Idh/MocA family oxidoreductase [Rhodospirillaceae bacterium]|nr:Gfo/Idh/MocA family oxidoreductase [Rhodospirillaceae bacterium]